ncbi:MAG: TonB family protein, partial [Pyrinomonadaceae bacterium]
INLLSSAVKQKEFKANATMWNYLGLAYIKAKDYKKARKALEKAVDLASDNSAFHVNLAYIYLLYGLTNTARLEAGKAIAIDPKNTTAYYFRGTAYVSDDKFDFAQKDADQIIAIEAANARGYLLSSRIQLALLSNKLTKDGDSSSVKDNLEFLRDSRDILLTGVAACKDSPEKKSLDDELGTTETFYDYFSKDHSAPGAAPDPSITPFKILSKPRASYTDLARSANVQGSIRLAVMLGANSKVEHVLILKRLGFGLDEQALKAAMQIRFEPKMKDGKAISTVAIFEYGFNIY